MKYKDKNVLVVGIGKSGKSVLNILKTLNCNIFIFDDNKKLLQECSNEFSIAKLEIDNDELIQKIDIVILSPGVSIYHEIIKKCNLYNVKVIGELEFAKQFISGNLIALTGSNGKTTTVSLIDKIFEKAKKQHILAGNIGNPLSSFAGYHAKNIILEVSSFQLESCAIKPNISAILNLSENHLDRHFSFKEYYETKFKIFENQTNKNYLILNADDKILATLQQKNIKPKIYWISTKKKVDGVCVIDNEICFVNKNKVKKICSLNCIKLKGEHNVSNVLFAVCVCLLAKIKTVYIKQAIEEFTGVQHRIQFIREIKGIEFVNDSKSTTPQSTLVAVNSFKKPVILILGGSDKGINYNNMVKKIGNKIKLAVLTGEICGDLKKCFDENLFSNYIVEKDFFKALSIAYQNAEAGDVVLLSPATASFDVFKNFEQRGECFNNFVEGLDD